MKDFLIYIGTCALDGRQDEITEHLIGRHVFGKGQDFNPAEDNIVRATARTLRVKLKEHFEGEGRNEVWRIEVPKGGYVPFFVPSPPKVESSTVRGRIRWAYICAALVVLIVVMAAWFNRRISRFESPRSIFTVLMAETPILTIVGSDSWHAAYQSAVGGLTPLEDYVRGRPFTEAPQFDSGDRMAAIWTVFRGDLLTSHHDLKTAVRLAHTLRPSAHVELRHPRTLRMADFREGGDFLLLAGQRANPWTGLFEPSLNFQITFPTTSGPLEILNANPRPGEQSVYRTVLDSKQTGVAFARCGLLPGLSRTGKILLVGGSTGEATAAAGEVLLNPRSLAEVEAILGRRLSPRMQRLEILVEITLIGGSMRDYRIISVRQQGQ